MESNTNTTPVAEAKACSSKECKCKGKKGLIAATILTTVLAIGGVGFGVYGMMKANSKPAEKKNSNPISTWNEDGGNYISYKSGLFNVEIGLKEGKVDSCSIIKNDDYIDCKIEGLTGKVYKIEEIGLGHVFDEDDALAFLLEDGTIDYAAPSNLSSTNNIIKIQGKVKIDGFVTDIIPSTVVSYIKDNAGNIEKDDDGKDITTAGHGVLFRLSDNTYVNYKEDMLQK